MSKATAAIPLDWPWMKPYSAIIEAAAAAVSLPPAIIAGMISRESGGGRLLSPPGPAGVGDLGHGKGLCQITDTWHEFARSGPWRDPAANINYGAALLSGYVKKCGDLKTGIAYYNTGESALADFKAGRDPDRTTTGGDYAADVIERAGLFSPLLKSPSAPWWLLGAMAVALVWK